MPINCPIPAKADELCGPGCRYFFDGQCHYFFPGKPIAEILTIDERTLQLEFEVRENISKVGL